MTTDDLAMVTIQVLRDETERLRAAAERVCWFDWSGNDEDAVRAIDDLRKALNNQQGADK